MGYDFDRVIDRRGTDCTKYDFATENGMPEDVLPLWIADMDFIVPEAVRRALSQAVDHGIFGYGGIKESYFLALRDWFSGRFGWEPRREWLVTTPGVVFALATAVRTFTKPGEAVLIQPPVYHPFTRVTVVNGRKLVENPLVYKDGRYTMDLADLERKVRDNSVKLMILCSPHNPVGRVWTREELAAVGGICQKYGVFVVSDEIHCDFTLPGHPHTVFLQAAPALAERTIVCTAPSKTFNLAGLQTSNIWIPGEAARTAFQEELVRMGAGVPNVLGLRACRAAYQEGGEWLDACKAYLRGNLDYVREYLARELPQLRLVEPEGTYFAWLDCSGLGMTEEALGDAIVHKAKLWLDDGRMFGAGQFQRVVLACPRATLAEAMDRLHRLVE